MKRIVKIYCIRPRFTVTLANTVIRLYPVFSANANFPLDP